MVTSAQIKLIAWIESEFIRRTLAVRRGGAPLDWVATGDRVSLVEIQAKATELGIEETGDDLHEWLGTVRDWSRWRETINHMTTQALEQEIKERTSAMNPLRI